MVCRPSSASHYDSKFTVKTTKHLGSVMVWGAFRGNLGQAGLYFLPKNLTMKGSIYINILTEHLCTFWKIHQCDHFIHDCAPSHDSKVVTKFLNSHIIRFRLPDNSPDLNPTENVRNFSKNKIPETRPSNINQCNRSRKNSG